MKILLVGSFLFAAFAQAQAPQRVQRAPFVPLREVTGFEMPESAFADSASDLVFVSNMGAKTPERDGGDHKGWLGVLDLKTNQPPRKWITGLDSPRGVRVTRNFVYIVERDALKIVGVPLDRKFDEIPATAPQVISVPIRDAFPPRDAKTPNGFLNDVVVEEGANIAYVSDMFRDVIYKISDYIVPRGQVSRRPKIERFIAPELDRAAAQALRSPNGLFLKGRILFAAGTDTQNPDGTPGMNFKKAPAAVPVAIDLDTRKVSPILRAPTGGFDGIAMDAANRVYVANFGSGEIVRFSPLIDGTQAVLGKVVNAQGEAIGPADISVDVNRNLLVVPALSADVVRLYQLR